MPQYYVGGYTSNHPGSRVLFSVLKYIHWSSQQRSCCQAWAFWPKTRNWDNQKFISFSGTITEKAMKGDLYGLQRAKVTGHKSWSCTTKQANSYLTMAKCTLIARLKIKPGDEAFSLSQTHALRTASLKRHIG